MKNPEPARRTVLALTSMVVAAVCAFALGACASTPKMAAQANPASIATQTDPGRTDPRRTALEDADNLIALFARIPGAVRVSKPPAVLDPSPAYPPPSEPGQGLVVVGWYDISTPYTDAMNLAQQILAPADGGLRPGGSGSVSNILMLDLTWDHLYPDMIGDRVVDVSTYRLTPQTSALAVEITDCYRPAKTAGEKFPDSGTLDVSFGSVTYGAKPDKSFEVTDAQTIARISALLDALPTLPLYGPASCPPSTASHTPSARHEIELTFRASAGAATTVQAELYHPLGNGMDTAVCGLGLVAVTLGGSAQPALDPAGTETYGEVANLLGLPTGS